MKPSAFAWLCLAAWPLLQAPAAAEPSAPAAIDARLQQCLDDPDKASTGDQDDCITQAEHEWDALLNQDYKRLGDRLPPDGRTKLRDAQRAWLRSRDADRALLGAVYATTSGTMYVPMSANDVMELTATRARRLEAYLAALDGIAPALPPPRALDDPPENGARLPHRAAAEAKRCPAATDACAARLAPAYGQDLAEIESSMARRLPHAARPSLDSSRAAWTLFRDREVALIDALSPNGTAVRKLGLSAERLALLDGAIGMIGRG
jgi:uncharacterized protein YecT (DUF1311 family)